jgi:2-desacetyl-2-hydroxyethyl bacteriochlorophyllide A dehydrogenase
MASTSKRIMFPQPGRAVYESFERPAIAGADDVLIETEFSIVSAGTELACRQGAESWAPLPFCPGYGSVGRVIGMGAGVKGLAAGQRILTYGKHASHALADRIVVPVPGGLAADEAVFARMAAVAATALRVSNAELGDHAAVFGLGLVGNLAAQLFGLAGCEVIGIDPSPSRRRQAEACGIPHVLAPGAELRGRVAGITGGRFCEVVVDATGLSGVILSQAHTIAAEQGEIVLLGSPRAPHNADVTPFLGQLHLCRPVAQVKGALEWRYPITEHPNNIYKHSIERNARQMLQLIADRKLKIGPLLTLRASPADCQEIYEGLANRKDDYTGVVFDWSKAA